MKILHINTASGRGGSSVSVELLHQELKNRTNTSSKLLVGFDSSQDYTDVIEISSKFWRLVNIAINRLTGLDSIWYPCVSKNKLKTWIDWADLVHIHNLHGYFFPLRFLKLLQHKPVIWTLRDYWLITGRCAYFKSCRQWTGGCGKCPDRKAYPRTWLIDLSRWMLRRKKTHLSQLKNITLVAISRQLHDIIGQSYLRKYHSVVIYNAIQLQNIEVPKGNHKHTIAFCSLYLNDEIKGYRKFIDILKQLSHKDMYRVVFFGHRLPTRDKSGLKNGGFEVIEHGYVKSRREVAILLCSAHLFVSTSLDEAFGKTTVEALACGVPVMCFDIPIMREIGGQYALYSPAFDVEAFARNIDRFFHTPYPYPAEELQRYAKNFSVSRMTQAYIDLYQRILANRL